MNINKDQINLTDWKKSLKFHYARGKGHLFRYIVNRLKWHYLPRIRFVSAYPEHVDIELSSACNMKCPMCYTITDTFKQSVKRKNMEWETIKKIVDECANGNVYSIRLSLRGESTLNKEFVNTVKYAKKSGYSRGFIFN